MRTSALLAPAVLLLSLACQPRVAAPVYGPWEEGLTLLFEDPSLPQPQRSTDRLQVRVARSEISPGSPRLVQVVFASTRGQLTTLWRHQDGGISLLAEDGRLVGHPLPAGFPATAAWTDRGVSYRVIGRAAWGGAAILPATSDPIGIWVEAKPPQGPRQRILYLPNLGEVEALEERDGTWIAVRRLVARGFTDFPAAKDQ